MVYRFIFDKEKADFANEKILPLAQTVIRSQEAFNPEILKELTDEPLLLFLSDEQIKSLVPSLAASGTTVALLPHPKAPEACKGVGVDKDIKTAIAHIRETRDPVKMDILNCNGVPIFNNMVMGQSFKLTSDDLKEVPVWRKRLSFLRFFNMQPFRVDISLPNNQTIKTAVSGIVVSEHRNSSLITRLGLEETSINDGKMHAFFISPRSVMEMFYHGIRSLRRKSGLPPFAAHVKTTGIELFFPGGPKEFLMDGKKYADRNIRFQVDKNKLSIIPGAHWETPPTSKQSAEIFRLKGLPRGEAAQSLSESKLPFIKHASTDEFKELFQILRDNARLKNSYLVLMVLSTVLATFGLFANSSPVVIGAMILAPLMSPIISLSMGALRHDKKLIADSFTTIAAGLGLSFLFAVLITWLTPIHSPGSEILARTSPNLLDLGIAVVSGIAGAYAYAREEIAKSLAGVAIAVALIPPLAVTSIGIGWGERGIFLGASLLLGTNLAGMLLAAAVTFMLLGFSPLKFLTRGMLISLLLVLILSIPLALGFQQMVYQHQIKKELENLKTEDATIKNVSVQSVYPMKLSMRIVCKTPLNSYQIDNIKAVVEERLQRSAEIEMVIAITR